MFEIKLTIAMPDLVWAAQLLAGKEKDEAAEKNSMIDSLREKAGDLPLQSELLKASREIPAGTWYPGGSPDPEEVPPYNASAGPVLPQVLPQPTPAPVTTTATMPQTGPAVTVTAPVPTAAPAYTQLQVATAGARLLTEKPELQEALMGLLGRYGVQTLTELPQEKLGAFAAELRGMGAKL